MRVCLNYRSCLFLMGACLAGGQLSAGAENVPEGNAAPVRRLTSVVRVDARSGRLTRSVVAAGKVAPKPVQAKVIAPIPVEPADNATASTLPANAHLEQIVEDAARRNQVDPLL